MFIKKRKEQDLEREKRTKKVKNPFFKKKTEFLKKKKNKVFCFKNQLKQKTKES